MASTGFCGVIILAFQFGLLPFFEPLFSDAVSWRFIYYGFWMAALGLSIWVLLVDANVRRESFPTLLVSGICLLLVLPHPVDQVTKNYIFGMILVPCVVVMALSSGRLLMLKFSASITALGAVICLFDVLFADGFTNSVGRAAGFGINPNVAAASLLLGACASFWAVPEKWRPSFLILVGSGIFVTLSRSTILIAAVITCITLLVEGTKRVGKGQISLRTIPRPGRGMATAIAIVAIILTALWTNDRFAVATASGYSGLRGAIVAFDKVSKSIKRAAEKRVASPDQSETAQHDEVEQHIDAQIEVMGTAADEEGQTNSASARGLLFQRSLLSYENGPFLGQGLLAAHELRPHNTYLLFAVAFGHVGWLVPLAFIALISWGRGRSNFQLGMATVALFVTSHDILLLPGLLVPIALGVAGHAAAHETVESPKNIIALKYVAAAGMACLLIASIAVCFNFGRSEIAHLDSKLFRPEAGFSYLAPLPSPPFAGLTRIGGLKPRSEQDSRFSIREDGISLADRFATPEQVRDVGKGQYMVEHHMLVFSSSDNSDPRFNGRDYEIGAPLTVHPLMVLVSASLLIWCIGVFRTRVGLPVAEG